MKIFILLAFSYSFRFHFNWPTTAIFMRIGKEVCFLFKFTFFLKQPKQTTALRIITIDH